MYFRVQGKSSFVITYKEAASDKRLSIAVLRVFSY